MRIFAVLAAAGGALGGVAHAQAVFAEFAVGAGFPRKVETIPYDVISPVAVSVPIDFPAPGVIAISPGDHLTGTLSGDYRAGITGGLQVGLRGVGDKHVSISVSYDYMQANLQRIFANGTLNGAPLLVSSSLATLGAVGADFNNQGHLVLGNVRWDFVGPREIVQPFIEIGGGGARIENSDTAAALGGTAGFRVPVGLGFYVGARYRYVRVFGYEDQLGIEYDDLTAHLVSFMLGGHM